MRIIATKILCFIADHNYKLVGHVEHENSSWLTIYHKCVCCNKVEHEYVRKFDAEIAGYDWWFWSPLTEKNLNDLFKA
ncbi:hypothetical protein CCP1ISM_3190002 [Azospirillaceae bacterium]